MKVKTVTVSAFNIDGYRVKAGRDCLLTAPDKRITETDDEEEPEIPVKTDDATRQVKIKIVP